MNSTFSQALLAFAVAMTPLQAAEDTTRLSLVGDSITIGYAAFMSDALDEPNGGYVTSHVGVGGSTAKSYLERGFQNKAFAEDADAFVMMFGTNDAVFHHLNEDWYSEFTTGMVSIIDQFSAWQNSAGTVPTLFLTTAIPITEPYWNAEESNNSILRINDWIRNEATARDLPLIEVHDELKRQPGWESWYSDGIHLRARAGAGYVWMADYISQTVDTHLNQPPVVPVCDRGDFDCNGRLDNQDIDALLDAIFANRHEVSLDLNNDGRTNHQDRSVWLGEIAQVSMGDANMDGFFDSADLVAVFQKGEYEDTLFRNSGWADGDWDGNGEFETADLVAAFSFSTYVDAQPLPASVPEPNLAAPLLLASVTLLSGFRRRQNAF